MENLGAADAGEEIFVAAGKAYHFVWEHRPDDDELVVIENSPVDFDGDIHLEEAARKLADFPGRDRAEVGQSGGIVPGVVQEAHTLVLAGTLGGSDFETVVDRFLGHGRVRAEGDHDIEAFGFAGNEVVNHAEEHADRRVRVESGTISRTRLPARRRGARASAAVVWISWSVIVRSSQCQLYPSPRSTRRLGQFLACRASSASMVWNNSSATSSRHCSDKSPSCRRVLRLRYSLSNSSIFALMSVSPLAPFQLNSPCQPHREMPFLSMR